jgi:UDP-glucose 4-epimerase
MNILITGSAGYIGGLLIEKYSTDPEIGKLICIDLLPQPQKCAGNPKIQWIQADLAVRGWEEKVPKDVTLDATAHCAFKIRNPYGRKNEIEANNAGACRNVFAFTFERSIPRLVYLSSVAAYGAKPENIGKLLTEDEPLSEKENPYGYQKAQSEKILNELFSEKNPATKVFVLRLNSVTGPRGQGLASKFGLITFLKKLLPFVIEANPFWARQFVHEDDVVEIVYRLSTKGFPSAEKNPEAFNVAPEKFLTAKDMAHILGKRTLRIPAWSVKPLFWIAWNVSLGHIPTRPDSAMGLIYPINVDGSRIQAIGFRYAHTAEEALVAKQ